MDIFLAATSDIQPLYSVLLSVGLSVLGCVVLGVPLSRFYSRYIYTKCSIDEDMEGQTVLIIGGSAGIGKAAVKDLARRNARIILASRNMDKAKNVAQEIISSTGNKNIVVRQLDLSSFSSVQKFAEDVKSTEKTLNVLINNADINNSDKYEITKDGSENGCQSNHFGHFLLTLLLEPQTLEGDVKRAIDLLEKIQKTNCGNELNQKLEGDVKRDIDLLEKVQKSNCGDVPNQKLDNVDQSDGCTAVKEVCAHDDEKVDISGSFDISTDKATVAASEDDAQPRNVELTDVKEVYAHDDKKVGISVSPDISTDKATVAANEDDTQPRNVELHKKNKVLGFNIKGGREQEQNSPIYISKIKDGGIAHLHGGLKVGDQLLSINGVSVEGETREKAVELLTAAKGKVILCVRFMQPPPLQVAAKE